MKLIKVQDSDLQEIEGKRRRRFQAIVEPLSAKRILDDVEQNQRKRVIVICNTVSQAQGIFKDLDSQINSNKIEIILLHSRFFSEDRAEKEASLETMFGKDRQKDEERKCHILIATQVIEVGLNITCEVMHSQLCPMSSLLQRVGRCARFQDEDGIVYIYREILVDDENKEFSESDIETTEEELSEQPFEKKVKFSPYTKALCEETWKVLQNHNPDDCVSFRTEEEWINLVHTKESQLQAKCRQINYDEFIKQYENAILRGDRQASRELIRLIDNRNIFVVTEITYIDDTTKEIDLDKLQPFSIPVSTLRGAWSKFQEANHQTWLFRRVENPSGKQAETYRQPIWSDIRTYKDIQTSVRILVNPTYVFYNERIGLWFSFSPENEDSEDNFLSQTKLKNSSFNQYTYHWDTYVEHLRLMWICWVKPFQTYASVREELLRAGGRFIQKKIFPELQDAEKAEALFEILIFFAILTHDLGKLQSKWQKVMQGWQKIANEKKFANRKLKPSKNHLLAHTDYDPTIPEVKNRYEEYMKINKRPPHAVESAFLSQEILESHLLPILENTFNADREQISGLMYIVMMAAGRHHSAWTNGWQSSNITDNDTIQLESQANQAIAQSWQILSRRLEQSLPASVSLPSQLPTLSQSSYPTEEFPLNVFESDDMKYQQLYALVVRALRLCDMRSVQLK